MRQFIKTKSSFIIPALVVAGVVFFSFFYFLPVAEADVSCWEGPGPCYATCTGSDTQSNNDFSFINSAWRGSHVSYDDYAHVKASVNGVIVLSENWYRPDKEGCVNASCGASNCSGEQWPPAVTFYYNNGQSLLDIVMWVNGIELYSNTPYGASAAFGYSRVTCNAGQRQINSSCINITGSISSNPTSCTAPCSPTISWNSNSLNKVQIRRTGPSSNTWSDQPTDGSLTDSNLSAGTYTYYLDGYDGYGTLISGLASVTVSVSELRPPVVNISASPNPVNSGSASTLSWNVTNDPDSCTATDDWSGAKPPSGSESTGNLTSSKTYTLTCTNAAGKGTNSVTVDVTSPSVSPSVTCNYSGSTGDFCVGDTGSWTISSNPTGYNIDNRGTKNGVTDDGDGGIIGTTNLSYQFTFVDGQAGNYQRWAEIEDNNGGVLCTTNTINFSVYEKIVPTVNCPSSGTVNTPFGCSLSITGGKTPYSCNWSAPAGCSISSSSCSSATISCSTAGSKTITASVSDSGVCGSTSGTYAISIGTPSAPTADIKANGSDGPISITYNSPVTLSWTSTNATSCSVTPGGFTGTSNNGVSSGNLTSNTTFTLSCSGPGGTASDTVEVRILKVSLTASPNSSTAPLNNVSLTANVSDSSSGTYRYFFDCTDDGINEKDTGNIFSNPYTASNLCNYPSPGTYTAKVEVWQNQGTATATTTVTVTNQPPTVSNVTITQPDYCTSGPAAYVNWTYSDPEGNPQSAYQVQIDDIGSAWNPPFAVDSGKVFNSGTSYFASGLAFNTTYKARVRVWDSNNNVSNWTESSSWKTPKHAYPQVNFTYSPSTNIPANQPVQFTDQTIFSDTGGTGQRSWNWLFKAPALTPSSTLQNPTYTYTDPGSYQVQETVTDKDGYTCPSTKQINISLPIPIWKEVAP